MRIKKGLQEFDKQRIPLQKRKKIVNVLYISIPLFAILAYLSFEEFVFTISLTLYTGLIIFLYEYDQIRAPFKQLNSFLYIVEAFTNEDDTEEIEDGIELRMLEILKN